MTKAKVAEEKERLTYLMSVSSSITRTFSILQKAIDYRNPFKQKKDWSYF